MRQALCALVVLALSLTACTADASLPGSPAAPRPLAVGRRQPSKPAPPATAPLTGLRIEGDAPLSPVLAIKIDNASAAVPQQGLDLAEVVFEEEVEGGITRFIALYQAFQPRAVGPVRSGREVDADLLPPFSPVLGVSGAAGAVTRQLDKAKIRWLQETSGGSGDPFYRVADRSSPHDLFVHTRALLAAGKDDLEALHEPVFSFDAQRPAGGRGIESVDLEFSPSSVVRWEWSGDAWHRLQNGSAHKTVAGEGLTADNVVVMRVRSRQGDRADSLGNPTLELDVLGRGTATVLRDGRAYPARWRKTTAADHIQWTTPRGEALPLRPGRTWIELLKTSSSSRTTR
ncbi:MAG: DUF3048 domain-containing protein [Actinomycetota bacterium]|nr:DUF3048 domain-containing protein [Actinomycetota bacterium]